VQNGMSALPLKADMCAAQAHVSFWPTADISRAQVEIVDPALSMAVHIALNRRRSDRTFPPAYKSSG